jgi:hypothetical protein
MSSSIIDPKREHKDLYQPPTDRVTVVEVPEMRFLAVDGAGDPNTTPAYQQAIEALCAMSYIIKFLRKRIPGTVDAPVMPPVMPLEGLWWMRDGEPFSLEHKDDLKWTLLIRQPDDVTEALVEEARRQVARKKQPPALPLLRLETWCEGQAAQIMYLGPYADEGPTIARLHTYIAERVGTLCGKHHEIYLGDPRRTAPEKLRTILRQPFV